jgi:hypothetical protein
MIVVEALDGKRNPLVWWIEDLACQVPVGEGEWPSYFSYAE